MDWLVHYWKYVKEYARDYVLENTGLKVLALLITAVLWLSVASRPISQIPISSVPIDFVNLSTSPELAVSKYDTLTARVFVEGPRDVLDQLRPSQLSVVADMTGVEPGVRVISLKASQLPPSVKLRDIEPRVIRVTVERIVEKEVPVKPRFEGRPAPGFELRETQVNPSNVKITGVESQVRDVNEVSTETVSLENKTGNIRERVAIDIGLPNLNITEDSPRSVMLSAVISEVEKERTIDGIPVTLQNSPRGSGSVAGYIKVVISGPRSVVDQITVGDISATIDYRKDGVGRSAFKPEVELSSFYSDRLVLKSFEPKTLRLR